MQTAIEPPKTEQMAILTSKLGNQQSDHRKWKKLQLSSWTETNFPNQQFGQTRICAWIFVQTALPSPRAMLSPNFGQTIIQPTKCHQTEPQEFGLGCKVIITTSVGKWSVWYQHLDERHLLLPKTCNQQFLHEISGKQQLYGQTLGKEQLCGQHWKELQFWVVYLRKLQSQHQPFKRQRIYQPSVYKLQFLPTSKLGKKCDSHIKIPLGLNSFHRVRKIRYSITEIWTSSTSTIQTSWKEL